MSRGVLSREEVEAWWYGAPPPATPTRQEIIENSFALYNRIAELEAERPALMEKGAAEMRERAASILQIRAHDLLHQNAYTRSDAYHHAAAAVRALPLSPEAES